MKNWPLNFGLQNVTCTGVSLVGHGGKGLLASGNTLFIYFSDISAGDLCRYQTFMPVFFLVEWKRIFKKNPSFWPAETDFLANGKHFVPITQAPLPLEVVLPYLGNII